VGKAAISGITPTTVNSSVRTREYLTGAEIERLMGAARKGPRAAADTASLGWNRPVARMLNLTCTSPVPPRK
jgi:hypothetical protein